MPPLATKKGVDDRPSNFDSRRVFSNYDDKLGTAAKSHNQSTHSAQKHPKGAKSRIIGPPCQNNPHPADVGFLRQDCKVLHEPICHVKTKVNIYGENDKHWWPSRTSEDPHKVPKYSQNSTNRADYKQWSGITSDGRHGNNPHKTATSGIVPVNHLPAQNGPRLIVERISYQHGYDSRKSPNQPQRGKLHGNFVWDVLHPVESTKTRSASSKPYNRTNSFPWDTSTSSNRDTMSAPPVQSKASVQSVGHGAKSLANNTDSSSLPGGRGTLSNIGS